MSTTPPPSHRNPRVLQGPTKNRGNFQPIKPMKIIGQHREQRTTVKICEMTERRRLGEVSDKEKSLALHRFQYDFRVTSRNFLI
ncbi:hypothetical protein AtNW77_Chr1g0005991 [Arabidopsis thaliana]|nr:hypothetical protein ISN45_At01g005560 [Arabidopsis thaliana x Arabidopsis arenosa]